MSAKGLASAKEDVSSCSAGGANLINLGSPLLTQQVAKSLAIDEETREMVNAESSAEASKLAEAKWLRYFGVSSRGELLAKHELALLDRLRSEHSGKVALARALARIRTPLDEGVTRKVTRLDRIRSGNCGHARAFLSYSLFTQLISFASFAGEQVD